MSKKVPPRSAGTWPSSLQRSRSPRRVTLFGIVIGAGLLVTAVGLLTTGVGRDIAGSSFTMGFLTKAAVVTTMLALIYLGVHIRVLYYASHNRAISYRLVVAWLAFSMALLNWMGHADLVQAWFFAGTTVVTYVIWWRDDRGRRQQVFAALEADRQGATS